MLTFPFTTVMYNKMHPKKITYSSYSLPHEEEKGVFVWSNPDDQHIIRVDINNNTISGHYYDWNETAQDWDDENDVDMTLEHILAAISKDKLILVTLPRRA